LNFAQAYFTGAANTAYGMAMVLCGTTLVETWYRSALDANETRVSNFRSWMHMARVITSAFSAAAFMFQAFMPLQIGKHMDTQVASALSYFLVGLYVLTVEFDNCLLEPTRCKIGYSALATFGVGVSSVFATQIALAVHKRKTKSKKIDAFQETGVRLSSISFCHFCS
jgi:hypothetical protein